jgi:dTDP-4-amino-4,6-dideoxygalactose transaminase
LVNEILDSGRVSGGRYVRQFEQRFAKVTNAKEAVAVNSGTDALIVALAVLHDFGAERGDEIIVPALSFVSTGSAVLHAGFKPVFVDIERESLNIDTSQIEKAITGKTRAILPVHLMGKPAKMDVINKIAKKYNLYVIEDASEAHGAVYKGKNIGTWGDMAAFSLYVAHIITSIEGGMVVTNRQDFVEPLRSLRSHGRACKCEVCVLNTNSAYCAKRFADQKDIRFIFERVGYSSKMNELEAAIGLGSLDMFDEIFDKRRRNLLAMMKHFKKFECYFSILSEKKDEIIGPHAFPFIIKENAPFDRMSLVNYLEKNGIDTRDIFSSIPTQCRGFSFLGYTLGDFPHAEYIGNYGLHVGVHQDLSQKHVDYFIDRIENFLRIYTK